MENFDPGKNCKFSKPGEIWFFKSVKLSKPREKSRFFTFPGVKKLLIFLTQWLKTLPRWIFRISKSPRWTFNTHRVTETGVFIKYFFKLMFSFRKFALWNISKTAFKRYYKIVESKISGNLLSKPLKRFCEKGHTIRKHFQIFSPSFENRV